MSRHWVHSVQVRECETKTTYNLNSKTKKCEVEERSKNFRGEFLLRKGECISPCICSELGGKASVWV